ncbi:MAG: DNA repair protein RadC, partial [Myxococcota bacterium]
GRRLAEAPLPIARPIGGPEAVARHFLPRLGRRDRESFHVLLLDGRHRLVGEEEVSVGTLTASLVHPREVFRGAIRAAAAALVLVHNHPSGDPQPSGEDRAVTRRLADAGRLLGIEVLDHVVVARGGHFSFREAGELPLAPG